MPSRLGVAFILLFWLAVAGHVAYRDVLPRLQQDTPDVAILIADEATRTLPAQWSVHRGGQRIGTLITRMTALDANGAYSFNCEYHNLAFEQQGFRLLVRQMRLGTNLTLDGRLAGQTMHLDFTLEIQGLSLEGTADIASRVEGGMLVGTCRFESPWLKFDEPLEPVPVRPGPVLNPMQPMNRLGNVRPGQRWTIRESNPLGEAVALVVRKAAKQFGFGGLLPNSGGDAAEFIAEVRAEPEPLLHKGKPVLCHVIDYRGERATARTWVAVADGRILRQEATSFGEVLRLERED